MLVWFWFCDQGEQPAGAVAMVTLRPFVVTFNRRLIEFHELKQNNFFFFLIMCGIIQDVAPPFQAY